MLMKSDLSSLKWSCAALLCDPPTPFDIYGFATWQLKFCVYCCGTFSDRESCRLPPTPLELIIPSLGPYCVTFYFKNTHNSKLGLSFCSDA